VDPTAVEQSRQQILDLSLFRSVGARVEDDGAGGARVVFTVDEKHFWVIFPRVGSNSQGDTTLGVHSRFNNLFGLNHTMGLNVDQRRYNNTDFGTSNEFFGRYLIPGIDGTRIDLGFTAFVGQRDRVERDPLGVQTATFDETTDEFSVVVTDWLGDRPVGYGWRIGGGLHSRQRDNAELSGTLVRDPFIRQVGASFDLRYEDMHHYVWSDGGRTFGLRLELGVPGLSDQNYQIAELFGRRIWQLGDRPHHNLYLDAGAARTYNIDSSYVSYGFGRPALRGVLKGVYEGDSYEYLRFGYLRPVFGNPSLRFEAFIDAGRQQLSGFPDPDASRIGIGVGLRWRIRSFVKLELAIGLVYSPDTGELRAWGGSNGLD
jgi:outer membrane protein assembly factor BamA